MPHSFIRYNKTRIAPTPSGFLHLGNILSFAITAAVARKHGAKILLRIDDLDRTRAKAGYIQDIFDTLTFLGIPWDEGPRSVKEFEDTWSQLHRLPMYKEALAQLSDNGLVFACTCSRKQTGDTNNTACTCFNKGLHLTAPNVSWRLKTDKYSIITVKNYKGENIQAALPAGMQHFVVKKKDGFPSYQLSSVIDDLFYGIDLVVRGEDLWESTLAQHTLASKLGENGFNNIAFHHHPLLTDASGSKLSKSAGATSVRHLRQSGKTVADVYTLIAAMLGSPEAVTNWQQLAELVTALKR